MAAPRHPVRSIEPRRLLAVLVAGVLVAVSLAGCAAGVNPNAGGSATAGFWLGLWHGFIAPIAFLVSLFNDSVGIYEVHNSGGWYDFGFLIGISAFFSGPAGAGRSRHRNKASRA